MNEMREQNVLRCKAPHKEVSKLSSTLVTVDKAHLRCAGIPFRCRCHPRVHVGLPLRHLEELKGAAHGPQLGAIVLGDEL